MNPRDKVVKEFQKIYDDLWNLIDMFGIDIKNGKVLKDFQKVYDDLMKIIDMFGIDLVNGKLELRNDR